MHGIEQQFLALQKGFNELIPQSLLKAFDERELELVIGGLGTIDLHDWRTNTRLKHCTLDTQQVGWRGGPDPGLAGGLVLVDRGVVQRGDARQAAPVRDGLQQGPAAGL